MTPVNDQGQNGTKGTTSSTTGGTSGMEPSTPAMGASGSTADPTAGGNKINVDDTQTRRGPDVSDSSASTQMASGAAAGSTGGMGDEGAGQQRFAKVREEAVKLRGQATDRARTAAEQGKTRATETLDGFAQAVHEAAGSLEQQVGPQVAQYAHRAADALDNLSASLRNKSVDQLVDDATNYARRSPAIAIGAAVALGFALSRFLKASSSAGTSRGSYAYDEDEDMPSMTTTRTTGGTQPRYNA